jgi:hypothetical protein
MLSKVPSLEDVPYAKHNAMKTYEGMEVYLHAFLTSVLDKMSGQRDAPATLLPGKLHPVTGGYEAEWAPEPVWMRWQ